jgi:DNA repair protein RadA/Sms
MAKKKVLFECQACGMQSGKWMGKCPNCGAWDEFVELSTQQIEVLKEINTSLGSTQNGAISITAVSEDKLSRFSSGDSELDLVLGGGIVNGSLTLIGGSPGVGKSTLLLKIAGNLARDGKRVLYVSGEESAGQIKLRSDRLGSSYENLYLLSEIRLDAILAELSKNSYETLIIDSIQTLYSDKLTAAPGSVSQVREITFELMHWAYHQRRLHRRPSNLRAYGRYGFIL